MRLLRLFLLAVAVLLGQAHMCEAYYVSSTGSVCRACAVQPCNDACKQTQQLQGVQDCHECCSLKSCDDAGKHAKADRPLLPPTLDIVLPVPFPPLPVWTEVATERIAISQESHYANAPPPSSAPRAPPSPLV